MATETPAYLTGGLRANIRTQPSALGNSRHNEKGVISPDLLGMPQGSPGKFQKTSTFWEAKRTSSQLTATPAGDRGVEVLRKGLL